MGLEICPKCLGAQELMTPKKTRGFEYLVCDLCGGAGDVPSDIASDFIHNEHVFDDEYFDDDSY